MPSVSRSSLSERTESAIHSWSQCIEPWYFAYALAGVTMAGLAPILLPLTVSRIGSAGHIGLVMAAFNLGGFTAPLWGSLSDRYRLHRLLLTLGLLTTTIGLVAFPFVTSVLGWLGLALLQGVGIASASTVANLFVVESHPKEEWDERIGWLQTFFGGGQVVGLMLASVLSRAELTKGLVTAAGLTALAALLGWLTTQTPRGSLTPKPTLLDPARHTEWVPGSPQRAFHHLGKEALQQSRKVLRSSFGRFLAIWLITFGGSAAVFSLYPVMMEQVFGVAPGLSSAAYAVAAGLSLTLYSLAGQWTDRLGASRVLGIGLGVRLLAFMSLLVIGLLSLGGEKWLALVAFGFVVLSWSLLTVSGTALTARLTIISEGEGMGLYNAITALAGVAGAALGGWSSGQWGYIAAPALAGGSVALGLLLVLPSPLSRETTIADSRRSDDRH
jgi:DHA1 family tetracycline resistance protein-like MFS transporter